MSHTIEDPPGFTKKQDYEFILSASPGAAGSDVRAYEARAFEIAKGQMGNVFQTGLMLYFMVGNQLALFNMILLVTFGMNPINSLLATERTFATVSVPGANILSSKAMYVALNLAGLAILVWKIKAMGLLPLTSADWVSLLPIKHTAGISSVPEAL